MTAPAGSGLYCCYPAMCISAGKLNTSLWFVLIYTISYQYLFRYLTETDCHNHAAPGLHDRLSSFEQTPPALHWPDSLDVFFVDVL